MVANSRKDNLSKEFLRECFDYDELTGKCIWRMRPDHHFKSEAMKNRWSSTKVGKEVGCNVPSGSAKGYIVTKIEKRTWYLHRLIYTWMTGEIAINVDHKNLCRSDNRWENLRNATIEDNCRNVKSRSEAGYKGVYRSGTKFRARIKVASKNIGLGTFCCAEDAARAFDEAAKEIHGEFALLNFPEGK